MKLMILIKAYQNFQKFQNVFKFDLMNITTVFFRNLDYGPALINIKCCSLLIIFKLKSIFILLYIAGASW